MQPLTEGYARDRGQIFEVIRARILPAIPRYMGLDFDIIIQLGGFHLVYNLLRVIENSFLL